MGLGRSFRWALWIATGIVSASAALDTAVLLALRATAEPAAERAAPP